MVELKKKRIFHFSAYFFLYFYCNQHDPELNILSLWVPSMLFIIDFCCLEFNGYEFFHETDKIAKLLLKGLFF